MQIGHYFLEKKRLRLVIIIVAATYVCWLIWSPYGIKCTMDTRRQLKKITTANEGLTQKNKILQKELDQLANDPQYLEEVARKRHGMVKKNEIIFEFKEEKND